MSFTGLFSCKSKKICAAYNSYFVYEDANIAPFFAPFGSDSLPGIKKENRFNHNGILTQSSDRNDKSLLKYKFKDFKDAEISPLDTSLMAEGDSAGVVIHINEIFPEKVNTDQEAYEHYMRKLNADFGKKKGQNNKGKTDEIQEFDSTAYFNNPPDIQTKEEKKQWKKDKKAYKKRKKARKKLKNKRKH